VQFLQYYWGNTWSQDAVSLSIQTSHPAMPSSFTTFQSSIQNPARYQRDTDILWETHPEIFHIQVMSYHFEILQVQGNVAKQAWKRWKREKEWYHSTHDIEHNNYKITHAKLNDFQLLKEKLHNYHFKGALSFHIHICTQPFSPSVRLAACFELMPSHSFSQSFQPSLSLSRYSKFWQW
jgi:Fe-S cluster biosynthesis and repair protein YggX